MRLSHHSCLPLLLLTSTPILHAAVESSLRDLEGTHSEVGAQYDLHTIVAEIAAWMKAEELSIPLIAAGGIIAYAPGAAWPYPYD